MTNAALSHIRVLDLSRVLAGPWAGQTMADLGADVIKVEQPGKGDDTRHWGPPNLSRTDGETGESAYFLCANRGKRSVCIDIKSAQGQAQLHRLIAESDVIIENFKTGQLADYQLDYTTVSTINPRIVYCSITGFGHSGPYAKRPGYDFLIQGMSGLMSVTGALNGEPQKVGVAVTDIMTGLYATIGILAALAERERSGLGQHIDMSLMDVAVSTMANQASNYLVGNIVPKPMGNAHPNIVPYQSFATKDGHCIVAVGNDSQFAKLCDAIGWSSLAENPRFCTNQQRVANRDALVTIIAEAMLMRETADWRQLFDELGVPSAPINTLDTVFTDQQVLARNMVVTLPHPQHAELKLVANPIKFSRTPIRYHRPPPLLGQHTSDILDEILE
ncbi:CoA transferase [Arenicella chitinivorans]|uniref:CoA transferase n=1 Tax=Arenicella chitinivorans TaxID=1329800 RepID=A0A918RGE5_9GAMM|nr:CoA transferase [Arenicella chitinivorans]GGZ98002.1 CoA transferase [Arenicella chitinivorans]